MMAVVELHDVKSAAVDIEVDIALLKIRRYGLPDLHLRMHTFNSTPRRIADALAVDFGRDKEDLKIAVISLCLDDHAADRLASCIMR